ncbi:TTAGGG repeat binding factor [Coemansia sp. RSA 518]|nr:TTAGGG repeat binding factor [Coemansia sp. RSA 518]
MSKLYDVVIKSTSALLGISSGPNDDSRRQSLQTTATGNMLDDESMYTVSTTKDNANVERRHTLPVFSLHTEANDAGSDAIDAGAGAKQTSDKGKAQADKTGTNSDIELSSNSSDGESDGEKDVGNGSGSRKAPTSEPGESGSGSEESGSESGGSDLGSDESGSESDESDSESEESMAAATQATTSESNTGEHIAEEAQAGEVNTYSQTQSEAPAAFIGPGSAADLMVLDYVSQRILNVVGELGMLLEDTDAAATDVEWKLQQLDSLAREHTLARQIHFTRELFLGNNERPADEPDVVQWAVALHRVNLATFVLLVFWPQVAVVESVGMNIPNRERLLASLGLDAAAHSFFAHIVPANRHGSDAIGLLIDIQTQQWLMAANDEKHLQNMVAEERQTTDAAIRELLSVDLNSSADDTAVESYRSELGRRLNKISGGKLAITRAQYSLHGVWKRAARFCCECATAMPLPAILSLQLYDKDADDNVEDDADQTAEQSDHESVRMRDNSDAESAISGDFEVTIFTQRAPQNSVDAEPQVIAEPEGAKSKSAEPEEEELAAIDASEDTGSIDPSFSEERRLAVVLRDAMDDPHLDALMRHINTVRIDIGQEQPAKRTPRRMHVSRNHAGTPPPQPNIGNDDDDFRLMLDEGDDEYEDAVAEDDVAEDDVAEDAVAEDDVAEDAVDVEHASRRVKRRAPAGTGSDDEYNVELDAEYDRGNMRTRRRLKRRASVNSTASDDDYSAEPEFAPELVKDILQEMKAPVKRTRIRYQHQASGRSSPGEFRGRRGIAAEDLAELRDDGDQERIAFTPSEHGSPLPDIDAAFESLGQYRPLRMEPRVEAPRTSHQQNAQTPQTVRVTQSARTPQAERATQTEQTTNTRAPVRQRRKHKRWSAEEEECFIKAVFEHGPRWSLIEDYHGTNGSIDQVLRGRDRVNLKDKARNIKLRLMRANKSLGPFENASGHI